MRRDIAHLFCLFPFEEPFYRQHGVNAHYIGHPLARIIKPQFTKEEFFVRHKLPPGRPLIALCPGSRRGEISRHLPPLIGATKLLEASTKATFVLAAPLGFTQNKADALFWERIRGSSIQLIEGETWDVLAHADLVLAASGTVTMEAALLGTPMITFYKVTALSWLLGRFLVRVPHYAMVNLIAQRRLAPELMQNEMTAEGIAREAARLLGDAYALKQMREDLKQLAGTLGTGDDPMEQAARIIRESFDETNR
jgi:lipid-A-disaccharide synthase